MGRPATPNLSNNDFACCMYILTDETPCRRSWKEPWSCMMWELDGDVELSQEFAKHIARYDNLLRDATHPQREESNALKISWSCCFQRRKEGLIVEEESTEQLEIRDGGHDTKPSTKWKTPWPRR